jgi:hypothetical protein
VRRRHGSPVHYNAHRMVISYLPLISYADANGEVIITSNHIARAFKLMHGGELITSYLSEGPLKLVKMK